MADITKKDHDDAIAKLQADHKSALEVVTKANEALTKSVADLKAELEKAKMSDDEKEHMEGMKDDEEKKKFLALLAPERQKVAKAAKAADETITVGGSIVRKSAVGAAVFDAMKAQQVEIEKTAKDLLKAQDEAEMTRLEKRADDEFGKVPGTTTLKARMLKNIMGWPEDLKTAGLALLKAHNDLIAKGFERLGANGVIDISKAKGSFMAKVSMIEARDKCTGTQAMMKARTEFPAEYEAYQNGSQAA